MIKEEEKENVQKNLRHLNLFLCFPFFFFADPLRAPFTLSLPNNRHFHMQRSHEGLVVQKVTYLSLDHFVQKNSAMLTLPCDKKYETRYPEATMGGTLYFD